MNDVKFYEEVVKNLYGHLEAIINLAQRADDSNWLTIMDQIESSAKQGLTFINTCTDYRKFEGPPDPYSK